MDNNLNEVVLDKLTKTCRCRVITRAKIKEAIRNGASTFEEVKEATGAGKGSCKGANCSYMINELIKKYNTDVDIMLEAKMKDEALSRLVRELKYKTNYNFIDDTSFIV